MRDYFKTDKLETPYCDYQILCGELKQVEVAFVVPTYKRLTLLKRCISSLLSQNYKNDYQIIISDNDPSTILKWKNHQDDYAFFAEHPNIVYCVNKENIGGGKNCNQVVIISQSKYICMVHDDDVLNRNHLNLLMDIVHKNNNIDYLCSRLTYLNPYKQKVDIESFCCNEVDSTNIEVKNIELKDVFSDYSCHMLGAIINRKKYLDVGGLGNQCVMEDYIFSINFVNHFNVCVYDVQTYGYCIQENDSLNTSVWENIICEQYRLREFLYPKIFKGGKVRLWMKNRKYLVRDIAIRESKKNIIKMHISRKFLKEQLKISIWDINIFVAIVKILIKINII